MRVNKATVDLVKKWEGFCAEAYLCPAKVWTIGYGTTAAAGVGITPVKGMKISEAEAEIYLHKALDKFAQGVASAIKVPVNENQFGACVSLAYNIGLGAFRGSTLLRKLNASDYEGAAQQFKVWKKAGGKVLQGLVNRRAEEEALFRRVPAGTSSGGGILQLIFKLLGLSK